jgi:hypothetical protein
MIQFALRRHSSSDQEDAMTSRLMRFFKLLLWRMSTRPYHRDFSFFPLEMPWRLAADLSSGFFSFF